MFTASVKLNLKAKRELLAKYGPAQDMLDRLVVDYSIPYVPFDTGGLSRSPADVTDYGSGRVIYPGPYAHYQYMGEVYGPNIPIIKGDEIVSWWSPPGQRKTPTGRPLKYDQTINALAGSFWIERMKADRMADLVREVSKLVANQK